MSSHATSVPSDRLPSVPSQRRWNLALSFQEALTAIVRIRFGRQVVSDSESFRAHIRNSLRAAAQDAVSLGYTQQDVQLALFALVALTDESVMNSRQAAFSDWARLPLQEELFGGHVAGEKFFENLQQVLSRPVSAHNADLLEVFYLCLLLGYRGRYAVSGGGDLRGIVDMVRQKIQHARGDSANLSPRAGLPQEVVRPAGADPWVKRLGWISASTFAFALILFGLFKLGLMFGASELRALASQLR